MQKASNEVRPILSCSVCGKRLRTTQGFAGHLRFKHPELVPGYERPEWAQLAKLLPARQILSNWDQAYDKDVEAVRRGTPFWQEVEALEMVYGCPCCRQAVFLHVFRSGMIAYSRVGEDFIAAWREAQDSKGRRRQGRIACVDSLLIDQEDEKDIENGM